MCAVAGAIFLWSVYVPVICGETKQEEKMIDCLQGYSIQTCIFVPEKHKIELYLHREAAKHLYPRLSLFVLLHIQHIRAHVITQEPNSPRCLHIDHLGGVVRGRTNTPVFFFVFVFFFAFCTVNWMTKHSLMHE